MSWFYVCSSSWLLYLRDALQWWEFRSKPSNKLAFARWLGGVAPVKQCLKFSDIQDPWPCSTPTGWTLKPFLMQCVYACPLTSRYNIHLVICSTNIQQVYCASGFGLMKEKTNACTWKSSPWSAGRDNRYLIQLFRETCKEIITGQSDQWYMTQQSTQSLVLGPKVLALTENNNMHMFRPYPFGPTKLETLSVGQQSVY